MMCRMHNVQQAHKSFQWERCTHLFSYI